MNKFFNNRSKKQIFIYKIVLYIAIILAIIVNSLGITYAVLWKSDNNPTKTKTNSSGLLAENGHLPLTRSNLYDFVTSDPINFDPFLDYGKEELWIMASSSPHWDALRNNIVSSFHYLGKPNTENLLKRDENGKITYEVNKDVEGLPKNVKRVIKVFDENKYNELTPVRNSIYTYVGFLTSAHKYPRFCAEKNDVDPILKNKSLEDVCRAEIATMFAHFAQEVGAHTGNTGAKASIDAQSYNIILANPDAVWPAEQWKQGLFFVTEVAYSRDDASIGYRQCGDTLNGNIGFPCFDGQSYHGRGAKQLSWNYNYGPFSRAMYGPTEAEVLLREPNRVATEGWLAISSAMYFYMSPRNPKPSIHDTVVGRWLPNENDITGGRKQGFGVSINIINGGLECGGTTEKATAKNRREYFEAIASWFNIYNGWYDNSEFKNDCLNMTQFQTGGDYSYEPSWGFDYINPTHCRLYGYEFGMFTPLVPGDFYRCEKALKESTLSGNNVNNRAADYRAGKDATYTLHANEQTKLFTNVFDYNPPNRGLAYKRPPWLNSESGNTSSGGGGGPSQPVVGEPTVDPIIVTEPQNYDTSDPINFDAFADYGKEELEKISSYSSWNTIRWNRIGSYSLPGKPDTENLLRRDGNGKITYEVNKNVSGLPENVKRVIKVFDETKWDYLTPVKNQVYTYSAFLTAVHKYPRFCAEKNDADPILKDLSLDTVCKGEIATVFAHFAQEVGGHDVENTGKTVREVPFPGITFSNPDAVWPVEQWRQGLVHVEEVGWTKDRRGENLGYRQCNPSAIGDIGFPCFDGQSYHGRGAKQLSYNYNYAPFSRAIFGPENAEVLLSASDRLSSEGWLALASAIYFYMTPREPKPSMHDATIGRWQPTEEDVDKNLRKGFGVSINIINGGVECGGKAEVAQAKNRKDYFTEIAKWLGAWEGWWDDPSYKNTCIDMQQFDSNSPTSAEYSWTTSWDSNPTSCQLVKYEAGPFNVYMPGDYYRCVKALTESTLSTNDLKAADYRVGKNASYTQHKDLPTNQKLYITTIFDYNPTPSNGGSSGSSQGSSGGSATKEPIIVDSSILTEAMLNDDNKEENYAQPNVVCAANTLVKHNFGGDNPDIEIVGRVLSAASNLNDGCIDPNDPNNSIAIWRLLKEFDIHELIFYYDGQWYWNERKLDPATAFGLYGGSNPATNQDDLFSPIKLP